MQKNKLILMCLLMVLNVPLTVFAVDCKTILAKLPSHTGDSSDQAKMVENFEMQCKQRPESSDPSSLSQCITVGMRAMAVSGNFVAAEKMAKIECEAGNDEISKNWMGMVLNNQHASEADRAVAQEAIDNK
ncbi:MAG: hypothetical protein AB7V32_00190 [Candidatus Berkiella sp.]